MVKLKGTVESTVPAHKSSANAPPNKKQDKDKKKEHFVCHKLGHFENRCPEKAVEIHHVNVGPVYTADAKVGCRITKVILDSGARKSMFPSKLIDSHKYPGLRHLKLQCQHHRLFAVSADVVIGVLCRLPELVGIPSSLRTLVPRRLPAFCVGSVEMAGCPSPTEHSHRSQLVVPQKYREKVISLETSGHLGGKKTRG